MQFFPERKKTNRNKCGTGIKIGTFFVLFFVLVQLFSPLGGTTRVQAQDPGFESEANAAAADIYQAQMMGATPIVGPISQAVGGPASVGEAALDMVNQLLYAIFGFIGKILSLSGFLLDWVLNPSSFYRVVQSDGVLEMWGTVRDLLNLVFIFILLFSAFCTVFQVEKYHIKKIILTLVIMALLVNFSYPITRFFMDVSNVTMYFILNQAFPDGDGASKSAMIANLMNISKLLLGNEAQIDGSIGTTIRLISSIVFMFVMTVSLFIMGVMLLIRIVALTILLIISPAGFVLSAMPFSGVSKYSGQWWDNLFKYSFYGPVQAFFIVMSVKMMVTFQMPKSLSYDEKDGAGFIVSMLYFIIPIVILWVGMAVSQSMGLAGAGAVVGAGQKFAKWAGMKASGADFAKKTWGAYQSRRKQAEEDAWSGKLGRYLGSKQDQLRSFGPGGKDAALRYQRDQVAAMEKESKRQDVANKTEVELKGLAESGNKFERAAALMELAAREKVDGNDLNKLKAMGFGPDSQIFKQINNKVRTYDPAASFGHIGDEQARVTAIKEFVESNKFDPVKMHASSLGNAEFMEVAMGSGAVSTKQIMELAGKNSANSNALKASVAEILSDPKGTRSRTDTTKEGNRALHLAHLGLTGDVHDSIQGGGDVANRAELFKRLDGEISKNMTDVAAGYYAGEISENINVGKVKDFVNGMKNNDARQNFVRNARNGGGTSNKDSVSSTLKRDPYLRTI